MSSQAFDILGDPIEHPPTDALSADYLEAQHQAGAIEKTQDRGYMREYRLGGRIYKCFSVAGHWRVVAVRTEEGFIVPVFAPGEQHSAIAAEPKAPLHQLGPPRSAEQCREAADRLQKHIDKKHLSAYNMRALPPTRKRTTDSQGIFNDAIRLEKIQRTLRTLADMHEKGSITYELQTIKSAKAVETALYLDNKELRAIFNGIQREETAGEKATRLERDAMLSCIPGFFPTPVEPADDLVQFLGPIRPGSLIFEPGAGSGSLIDAILRREQNIEIRFCEYSGQLRELLRIKYGIHPGSNRGTAANIEFLSGDLYDIQPGLGLEFDYVVMNPPFERGQDIEHVRHCYKLLKNGGVLVAIMSEGVFFRSDAKASDFRAFLRDHNWTVQALPEGSFRKSGTGASSRMVRIEKPW